MYHYIPNQNQDALHEGTAFILFTDLNAMLHSCSKGQ